MEVIVGCGGWRRKEVHGEREQLIYWRDTYGRVSRREHRLSEVKA